MEKKNLEMIVSICNQGFSEVVMNAAREAGARGGTILHARGTGNTKIEDKYGFVVTPEKEVTLIITSLEDKNKILTAINKVAGIETKGKGIVFSLPIDDAVGLKFN